MKRASLLLLILILCLTAACGEKEQPADRLTEILDRGYITVATEPYFAPQEFIDPSKEGDEQYVGADIELAKLIADKLGVECRIVPLDFTTVHSSVTEGKYDLAISALAYKPDRAENMNLSDPYYVSEDEEDNGYTFVTRTEDADAVSDPSDLSDMTVVVQQGSLQQYIWEQSGASCREVKYVSSTNDAFLMVSEGKADAVITAVGFARLYIEANKDSGLTLNETYRFEVDEQVQGTVMGMKKGEDALLKRINEIIAEVVESGVYVEWMNEYRAYAAGLGLM